MNPVINLVNMLAKLVLRLGGSNGFFPLQHQDGTLRDDKIFLPFVDNFGRATEQKNGNVPFTSLQRNISHLVVFPFPRLTVHRRWYGIAWSSPDDIPLLDSFFFLNPRRKVEACFGAFIWLGRTNQHAVTNDDEFLEPVIGC